VASLEAEATHAVSLAVTQDLSLDAKRRVADQTTFMPESGTGTVCFKKSALPPLVTWKTLPMHMLLWPLPTNGSQM